MAHFFETVFGVAFVISGAVTLYYEGRKIPTDGKFLAETVIAGAIVVGVGVALLALVVTT